ncbi:mediator of RNA polymerase II transcription subunit 14-like [Anneissia japonica]|uniref:mediator of RNA polymerase II transcription subunit 14-like n=1 Tax=Anneissia japonica TaxID=1529436 RepID=UPI001425AC37|nr:mediator of RNA polymerase II transcription subunit 14-like [Anneissia japonica]
MAPIESNQSEMNVMPMGAVGGFSQHATAQNVSLAYLLDCLIQRTYHDLIVLSELLPRKMDMEKKIEIVKFASKTRQSFIRLLALVKWASSAAKVDKCAAISAFLDHQGLLLVDTADMLARMARENLVHARLPNFSIPCAVDVLTTGRYRRLPTCIKDRIVPADPITASEKTSVLLRLNQIIQHRLVTSELPTQLSNLSIVDGTVKFHVPQEFEATLTLMGDDQSIPWRLLHVDILVKDPDTGDGKALVHSMQIHYIHQLVQSRLFTEEKPLADMYSLLHSFCQSLQLEVLNSQAHRLMRERWGEHIAITGYMAAQSLNLAYWRAQNYCLDKSKHQLYSVNICVDKDSLQPLDVKHTPPLTPSEAAKVNQAIKSEMLSIERLLVESILIRSKAKLQELQLDLKKANISTKAVIQGNPPVLSIAILEPCGPSEYLTISVDMQTGLFQPYVAHAGAALLEEIEECLNSDPTKLYQYIIRLKFTISIEHCKRAVQLQPVTCLERLPLVSISADHPLTKVSPNRLYLKLTKHNNYYVVVEFITELGGEFETQIKYYLLRVRPSTYYDQTAHDAQHPDPDTAKSFLAPLTLFPIDPQSLVHGPNTAFEGSLGLNKRKQIQDGFHHVSSAKRRKFDHEHYFQDQLAHITALCDMRIPYIQLLEELSKNNICHQGVQVEGEGAGLVLKLTSPPPFDGTCTQAAKELGKNLISCCFRLQLHSMRWQIQLCFANCPLRSTNPKEQVPIRSVSLSYDHTTAGTVVMWRHFIHEWSAIVRLYKPVLEFAPVINDYANQLNMEVRSFSYKRLTMAYGKDKANTVTIRWEPERKCFTLPLGTGGSAKAANCHVIIMEQLRQEFNQHQNIAQLMQVLQDTYIPLQAIAKLPTRPGLGAGSHAHYPLQQFCVVPQSSTHIRIAYRSIYCIDIQCRGKNMVAIRDGAHSLFDTSKVVTGFNPTPSLKVFLDMFVDDTILYAKRRSITEDDNPPSPVAMDTMDLFPQAQQPTGASPLQRASQHSTGYGHAVASSPAHPASPHTSVLQQQYNMQSPGVACPLASPPTITPSPSGAKLGTPSPAFAAGSPGNIHHAPSPGFVPVPSPMSVNMHSPAAVSFINPGMHESHGSPYTNMSLSMPSPRNWPASPSVPGLSPSIRHQSPGSANIHSPGTTVQQHASQPSMIGSVQSQPTRSLPHRSWAGSIPTILSHDALHKLCTPTPTGTINTGLGTPYQCCPLERFLSAIFLKKQLQRVLLGPNKCDTLHVVPSNEPGVIQFQSDSLLFRVSLNPAANLTLHLQAKPVPECSEPWTGEELHVLSKFFEEKVACPPYKQTTLSAFIRLISASTRILHDFIQIMRLELVPDRTLKWTLQWCLTISPNIIAVAGVGSIAVVVRNKILFFIQLTRNVNNLVPGQELQTIIVPIIHDPNTNSTLQLDQSLQNASANSASPQVSAMLKRFNEYNINSSECSIFPAIRDLMMNLTLPSVKI